MVSCVLILLLVVFAIFGVPCLCEDSKAGGNESIDMQQVDLGVTSSLAQVAKKVVDSNTTLDKYMKKVECGFELYDAIRLQLAIAAWEGTSRTYYADV